MQRYLNPLLCSGIIVIIAMTLLAPALADTVFNYDGFYARMKKSEKPEYSEITLAFLLQKSGSTERCQIDSAAITTDISAEPLTLAVNGELILPYNELLNSRKALIQLKQQPDAVPCDLNFRLRSRLPLDKTIALAQLHKTQQQFDGLLKDLAGLGKYFLPDMVGVTALFSTEALVEDVPAVLLNRVKCEGKQCHIDLSGLDASATGGIRFSQTPDYLVPLLQR
ncbi:MAG: DUF2987 domain-containing protein [Rheinheimera sp.]|nr:MAG: DUF2987 domain-containing protein [Rheinheimera sp.]